MYKKFINSFYLHIIAMSFMFCDHLWATIFSNYNILTYIGRLAFPIFAFLIVEGYFHTSNLNKYLKRLFVFAIISEIHFNLMYNGTLFYPLHQNVLFTFLIALLLIIAIEKFNNKFKNKYIQLLFFLFICFLGYLLGSITMVDYFGPGILTVLAFYYFRGNKFWQKAGQFASLYFINCELLKGLIFDVNIFGQTFSILEQGLALLSLLFILSLSFAYISSYGFYFKLKEEIEVL